MKLCKIISLIIVAGIISCSKESKDIVLENFEKPTPPLVKTDIVRAIGSSSLQIGGNILSDGNAMVTVRGVCWSQVNHVPTIYNDTTVNGTGKGSFTSYVKKLKPNTKYYFRAYGRNVAGITYGSVMEVTTLETVTDNDANVYNTVKIGSQIWMTENLKTTRYRGGDPIRATGKGSELADLTVGTFTNNAQLGMGLSSYGAYYNWAAITDKRNICPIGWHIPTRAEWELLINNVNGENNSKIFLLENYTYASSMNGATNESGFSAIPSGMAVIIGETIAETVGDVALWSITSVDEAHGSGFYIGSNTFMSPSIISISKSSGIPVRCIKD